MKTAHVGSEDPKPGTDSSGQKKQGKAEEERLQRAHSKKGKAKNHQLKIILAV